MGFESPESGIIKLFKFTMKKLNAKLVWGGLLVGICTMFLVGVSQFVSSGSLQALEARHFSGNVTRFEAPLTFRLDCCWTDLTLGLVSASESTPEDISRIEEILREDPLSCTAFGRSSADAKKVWCSVEGKGLISERLVQEGLVREICEETANQFGTCE